MSDSHGKQDQRGGIGFPWRQALVTAGIFAVLIMGFGSIDVTALGAKEAIEPWWLLLLGLSAAVLGFAVVVCEWLARRLLRRVGVSTVGEMEIRSFF